MSLKPDTMTETPNVFVCIPIAPGSSATHCETTSWTPGWTDGSLQQPDDAWTAFSQESSQQQQQQQRQDVAAGEWWPAGAVEERRTSASHTSVRCLGHTFHHGIKEQWLISEHKFTIHSRCNTFQGSAHPVCFGSTDGPMEP